MEALIGGSVLGGLFAFFLIGIPLLFFFVVLCGIFARAGRAADALQNISAQLAILRSQIERQNR
jgi:hypothetical protein